MKSQIYKAIQEQKGFTLLFSTLIAALVLSIGIAITNITLTQILLASAGKDSQFSFYAADSGIECALKYVYQEAGSVYTASGTPNPVIFCNGMEARVLSPDVNASRTAATTTFIVNSSASGPGPCDASEPSFEVRVGKSLRSTTPVNSYNVHIESRGYNTCDVNSPRRVERGLYVDLIE